MNDFRLRLGAASVVGSSGILTSNGKELIGVELSQSGELLVNVEVYDKVGQHVAKLNHNAWAFNDASYKVRTLKSDLTLMDGAGNVVLEVNAGRPGEATIRRATLYTPKGSPFTVTPESVEMPGASLHGNVELLGTGMGFEIGE